MRYNNYHKHTHYSNIVTLDVVVKPEDYMKRALELGHTTYFTTEHGYNGNIFEAKTLCDKYNLKLISGIEAYYVENRKEKDKSNYHLIIIALNTEGFKEINYLLSKSNTDGYYYKPRIDDELLFSLNPDNVIITTACIAGRLRNPEGREEWLIKMKEYFKNHFYLEIQPHMSKEQIEYNKMILYYHNKYKIELIHANDSHYIYPEQKEYRNMFLKAKNINYPEEEGFILDYPSYETIIERYKEQNVFNVEQIAKAIENTLIFDTCEDLDIDKEIKMPNFSQNPEAELKNILNNAWIEERKNIPKQDWEKYLNAIREETKTIEETNMSEYFVLNYYMIKNAIEKHNGVITKTGRGSAPSFYVNKLLGFTNIDRVDAPITLFPSRFMSKTRILETKSMPDIDFNCADTMPFYQSSKELLGEDGCYWMIAYKPLQTSSAFRLWCKASGLDISEYNSVAMDLAELSKVKKDYKESNYYQEEKWKKLIDDSQNFVGVIESIAQHPCSTLLMDKPISREVGLVKAKDVICANITSYESDNYKYLKNDLLTVTVWDIINKTCEMAKIKTPSISELNKLLDKKTFDIYKDGLTATVNQVDSDYATGLVKEYKPQSVAEVSAFVAILRPGCASLLQDFIHRRPYTTGVEKLDDLLIDGSHRMIYQELIMKYLIWLGIKEDNSYDVIKKIAKKKFKEKELEELKSQLKEGWIKQVGTKEHFEETWKIVEDAARYSFNCSHSLSYAYDSLYGAYLKSHYPLEYYTVVLNFYESDFERTSKITQELKYFNIKLSSPKFRYSFGEYTCSKDTKTIYKSISSIKGLSKNIGNKLFDLKDNNYMNFFELLIDCKKSGIGIADMIILIKLDYFSEFGKVKKLLNFIEIYEELFEKKIIKKDKEYKVKKLYLKNFCKKETEKQYSGFDSYNCLLDLFEKIPNEDISIKEKIEYQLQYFGYIDYVNNKVKENFWAIVDINSRNKNKLVTLYQLCSGQKKIVKIKNSIYNENPFNKNDILEVLLFTKEGKWVLDEENNEWVKSSTMFDDFINNYELREDVRYVS